MTLKSIQNCSDTLRHAAQRRSFRPENRTRLRLSQTQGTPGRTGTGLYRRGHSWRTRDLFSGIKTGRSSRGSGRLQVRRLPPPPGTGRDTHHSRHRGNLRGRHTGQALRQRGCGEDAARTVGTHAQGRDRSMHPGHRAQKYILKHIRSGIQSPVG